MCDKSVKAAELEYCSMVTLQCWGGCFSVLILYCSTYVGSANMIFQGNQGINRNVIAHANKGEWSSHNRMMLSAFFTKVMLLSWDVNKPYGN